MKKKVLFIHASLGGGGAERILIDTLRNIDYSMYDVDLALVCGCGVYMKDIPEEVHYLGSIYCNRRGILKRIIARLHLSYLFEPREINRLVKGNYDTIVSFLEGFPTRYHSYILKQASNNVAWVHCDLFANHWSRWRYLNDAEEAAVYSQMDSVVFVSQNGLDAFRRLFHYEKDNLRVIHNPIDKDRIVRLAAEGNVVKEVFTYVAVGRLSISKRYDRMIKAVRILKDRGCHFRLNILGAGDLDEELKRLTRELEVDDCVCFYGYVENPYPFIKASDVLVLSSDSEGYSTVVCEAMTLGVPVVGTNVTGINDIVGNNEYGFVTDLTPESFADAMYLLYSDHQKRLIYAEKAQERAESFSVENAMKKIYSVI